MDSTTPYSSWTVYRPLVEWQWAADVLAGVATLGGERLSAQTCPHTLLARGDATHNTNYPFQMYLPGTSDRVVTSLRHPPISN